MKKVLCPKCDDYVTFNENRYDGNSSLFFICPHCGKEFNVSMSDLEDIPDAFDCGSIVILENAYGYRQELPLSMGDNIIGRRSKGTEIQVPVESGDTSFARQHCVINVKKNKSGKMIYTLRDFPSMTGTFLRQQLLAKKEQVVLENGAIVTVGATTFIVYFAAISQEYED